MEKNNKIIKVLLFQQSRRNQNHDKPITYYFINMVSSNKTIR